MGTAVTQPRPSTVPEAAEHAAVSSLCSVPLGPRQAGPRAAGSKHPLWQTLSSCKKAAFTFLWVLNPSRKHLCNKCCLLTEGGRDELQSLTSTAPSSRRFLRPRGNKLEILPPGSAFRTSPVGFPYMQTGTSPEHPLFASGFPTSYTPALHSVQEIFPPCTQLLPAGQNHLRARAAGRAETSPCTNRPPGPCSPSTSAT